MSSYLVTTSGNKLITRALRLLGVLGVGKSLSSQEQVDGLESLNAMLDSWNTNNLCVPGRTKVETALSSGVQAYTIGEGATIDTPRPVTLESGEAFLKVDNIEYPLDVITVEEWSEIPLKTIGTRPRRIYYDSGLDAQGFANVFLFPIPDQATYTLVLWIQQQIKQISNGATAYQMPPGYARAIAYNLAIELAPEYTKSASPEVVKIASDSLGNIKRVNAIPRYLSVDPALLWNSRAINDLAFGGGGASSMPSPDFSTVVVNTVLPSTSRWLVVEASGGVGGITITLPLGPNKGDIVTVEKMDNNAGAVQVAGTGPQLPYDLVNQYQSATFIWDSAKWVAQAQN